MLKKKFIHALAGVAQWIECQPASQLNQHHWFNSQAGHKPGLQAWSPGGGVREASTQ